MQNSGSTQVLLAKKKTKNGESPIEKKKEETNRKRDDKKDPVLICSYCQGAYHLSCIINDPKWNKDLRPSESDSDKR